MIYLYKVFSPSGALWLFSPKFFWSCPSGLQSIGGIILHSLICTLLPLSSEFYLAACNAGRILWHFIPIVIYLGLGFLVPLVPLDCSSIGLPSPFQCILSCDQRWHMVIEEYGSLEIVGRGPPHHKFRQLSDVLCITFSPFLTYVPNSKKLVNPHLWLVVQISLYLEDFIYNIIGIPPL